MVNENIKTIIENKKPVETVQELKDESKTPSLEEFMKDYQADEKVNGNYKLEVDSYDDIRINKSYGPGNSQSSEEVAKYAGRKVASKTAGSLLGPAALPIGVGLKNASEGLDFSLGMLKKTFEMAEGRGSANPKDFFEELKKEAEAKGKSGFAKWVGELGKVLMEEGVGNVIGEFASNSSGGVGNFFDGLNNVYEQYGNAEDTASHIKLIIHLAHLNKGIDYDPNCERCKS